MKKQNIKLTQEEMQYIITVAMSAQHSKECGNPNFKNITSKEIMEKMWNELGGK